MNPAPEGNSLKGVQSKRNCTPLLETATREVFEIMLGTQLNDMADVEPPLATDLTAMVGLAGQLCGVLSIRGDARTASRMASKMLGVETDRLDENVRDAIGEICNMVAGNFKSKIAHLANGCSLSVPTVIIGGDYRFYPLANSDHTEVSLGFEGAPIWVTLDVHN